MYKTFKIGEYAVGGIVVADVNNGVVKVTVQDWDTKETVDCKLQSRYERNSMEIWLNEITTCYFAGKILDYIEGGL